MKTLTKATVDIVNAGQTIERRVARVNLDVRKNYKQVKGGVETYVGRFVRVYHMGSGDGTTVHIEFNNDGRIVKIDEEMWGTVSGDELSYFVECDSNQNQCDK